MDVKVFSVDRLLIELSKKNITDSYSIISFSDSPSEDMDFKSLLPSIDFICIHFRDYDYCDMDEDDLDAWFYEYNDLIEFIKSRAESGKDFVCQCWEGHSRSAATAAAILKCYCKDGKKIFDDPHYEPNSYLYKKILNGLKKAN